MSRVQDSLDRALSATTLRRRLHLPVDLADQVLSAGDEVLLALPGLPDDTCRMLLVTQDETVLAQWDSAAGRPRDVRLRRSVPAATVRGASYLPGLSYPVEIAVEGERDLELAPCSVEDGIRFAHAVDALARTGAIPPPLPAKEVIRLRHAEGPYAPDTPENRARAAWDRALAATTALWNCGALEGGPDLGILQAGEHTHLVLVGSTSGSVEYMAVTDRRVLRGEAPGGSLEERAPAEVRAAVYDSGLVRDTVRVHMHDGGELSLGWIDEAEGREFVEALTSLIDTGRLPEQLRAFR